MTRIPVPQNAAAFALVGGVAVTVVLGAVALGIEGGPAALVGAFSSTSPAEGAPLEPSSVDLAAASGGALATGSSTDAGADTSAPPPPAEEVPPPPPPTETTEPTAPQEIPPPDAPAPAPTIATSVQVPPPQALSAVPGPGVGQVTITWAPPAGSERVVYGLTRDVTPIGPGMQVASTRALSFVDVTPSPGSTYYYFATALTTEGASPPAGPAMVVSFPGEAAQPLPELSTFALVAAGLVGVAAYLQRR